MGIVEIFECRILVNLHALRCPENDIIIFEQYLFVSYVY